jgi:hypothetical protein
MTVSADGESNDMNWVHLCLEVRYESVSVSDVDRLKQA